MYISELNLHGFKSFAKKEKLKFGEGITVIVGPNGCGKTNIVDAIRWVLGEQKYSVLRSGKMEDVIFNGAENLKPLSVCEATLTVHNNRGKLPLEYNDIEIGRRVYRDGSSEYFLNRTPCRLKDIHDLFVDTGMGADAYSVIELKMIEQILSESAGDRKHMMEEAAGINKYKEQRRSSLRKFDAVKQDLERISDVINEVEGKVHSLALQLKRYERHAKLSEELKEKEVSLAFIKVHDYESRIAPIKQKVEEFKHLREEKVSHESVHEKTLEDLRDVYRTQQGELEEGRKALNLLEEERESFRNHVLVSSEQHKAAQATIERLSREQEAGKDKTAQMEGQSREYKAELKALTPALDRKLAEYKSKKDSFEKVDAQYKTAQKSLEDAQSARWEAQRKLSDDQSLLQRTLALVEEKKTTSGKLKDKIESLAVMEKENRAEQKSLESGKSSAQKVVDNLTKKLTTSRSWLSDSREKYQSLSLDFHESRAKIETLKSQLQFYEELVAQKDGYPEGTRLILDSPKDFPEILGTIGDLFQGDEKYSAAFDSALGDLAKCLVVKDRKDALNVLKRIQDAGGGEVSILPIKEATTKVPNIQSVPQHKSILGTGLDLAGVAKPYVALAKILVGNLLIVEDIKLVIKDESLFGWDLADLKGAYIASEFIMKSRGTGTDGSIIGRQKKIDALAKEIQILEKSLTKRESEIAEWKEKISTTESDIKKMTGELESSTQELNQVETALIRNHYGQSQVLEQLNSLQQELSETHANIEELTAASKKLEPGLAKGQGYIEKLKKKADSAAESLMTVQQERDAFHQQVQDLRIELLNLENKRDNLNFQNRVALETITELKSRNEEIVREVASLEIRKKDLKKRIDDGEEQLSSVSGKLKKERSVLELKRQAAQDTYQSLEELQAKIRAEQQSRESILEELKHCELNIVEWQQRINLIRERIHDRYNAEVPKHLVVDEYQDDLELRIERIQRSIDNIGPINMAVQQEHEEESQRLTTLNEQRDDLIGSEENLRETIQKIDQVARKKFIETFDQIKLNFEKLFTLFFEGGNARLTLIGDPDPLEADIAIHAQPPGKKNQSLRMLSAGEKSLTAIALLFAIYQYKPSPYCILDEVDAPLDDVNIRKFTRVLDQFAGETQFIVVTHNKLTMEAANYMYGVTMENKGVSKLVSVKFNGQMIDN